MAFVMRHFFAGLGRPAGTVTPNALSGEELLCDDAVLDYYGRGFPPGFLSRDLFDAIVSAMARGALDFYRHARGLGLRVLAVMPPQRVLAAQGARPAGPGGR